jgi:hypothetical protein
MRALGVIDSFVASVDPCITDVGQLRADEVLPQGLEVIVDAGAEGPRPC